MNTGHSRPLTGGPKECAARGPLRARPIGTPYCLDQFRRPKLGQRVYSAASFERRRVRPVTVSGTSRCFVERLNPLIKPNTSACRVAAGA